MQRAQVERLLGPLAPAALRVRNAVLLRASQASDTRRYARFAAPSIRPAVAKSLGNLRAQMMFFTHQLEKGLSHDEFRVEMLAEPIALLEDAMSRWVSGGGDPRDEFYLNASDALRAVSSKADGTPFEGLAGAVTLSPRTVSQDPGAAGSRSFRQVAQDRRSVRVYGDEPFDDGALSRSVGLAMTSPSACNRQATRVHIYSDETVIRRILEIQGGVRGYSCPPRLLAITSDLTSWFGGHERHQGYVDAGIFAMSLLLALEEEGLAACALNTMTFSRKDRRLRRVCAIPESEVFAMLIAVGPRVNRGDVLTPKSHRHSAEYISTHH